MNEGPSRERRKYFAVDNTGSIVCNTSYTATCPSQAAKKVFYSHIRCKKQKEKCTVEACGASTVVPECSVPSRSAVLELVHTMTKDEAIAERFCDRYLAAAESAKTHRGVVRVTEDGRPRIWSYLVYRLPRWPINKLHVVKGIYTSTFSRRLK